MKSLYNDLQRNGNRSALPGNMQDMVKQFNEFKATFSGDPKAEVERLIQSGRISQAELNQLQAMASELQKLLT